MRDGLWDIVTVTRNGQDLGNLYEIRQCLELWEQEMEKWGCNGLGEKLGDKLTSRYYPLHAYSVTKLTMNR